MLEIDLAIVLDQTKERHFYTRGDGISYPSVTTILDAVAYNKQIVQWANSLGFRRINYSKELDSVSEEGSAMHALAQCIVDPEHGKPLHVKEPLIDYYARQRAEGLRLKLESHKGHWQTIFTEASFLSPSYEIGGTIDWYTMWYDRKTLFDFKSSKSLRTKHLLQLGGYDLICQDNGEVIDQAGIILVKRDNCVIHIFERELIDVFAKAFLKVKDWYYASKELDEIIADNPSDL